MFKDILYPLLRSVQNQTLDRRIMYLTGTLVNNMNTLDLTHSNYLSELITCCHVF